MKLELANELGVTNKESDSVNNIYAAGRVGGLMTRKLVEMGEKEIMDKE
ncbi:MAG: small, acid-soluble spore protein, alpha/beta type [Tissierellia bacterium]|nr:small, acid-soluble spore protein, alpha/beta type [Tissierellia bacterium]